tara:strand:- start:10314 stop:10856 length:543 start_codon:yes stop_codon:yes gene_type:complete
MVEYEEVWSNLKENTALAVFDNAYNDSKESKLLHIPRHRDYQRDISHPKWYGNDKNFLQVAKDRFMKDEGLPPHEHVSRPGYGQFMIDNNYAPLHIDEFIYVVDGELLVRIYDLDDSFILERTLKTNDFFIYWKGGAAVKALLDDTRVFVIKPGPYEGPEMDKRDFEDKKINFSNYSSEK